LSALRFSAIDEGQRFVERDVSPEIDFLARQMRHPARRVLKAEHQAPLEMVLRALKFGGRHRRFGEPAELGQRQVGDLADLVGRAAGVHGDHARIAV
jgi:hypothetical protein